MEASDILTAQMEFYRRNRAGCAFAAFAAKDHRKYGWTQTITAPNAPAIDALIQSAITDPKVTMVSAVFPTVDSPQALLAFADELRHCSRLTLGQKEAFGDSLCLGFRVLVPPKVSWISGFAPFEFMPVTRRAPYVELAFRVKPRPDYRVVLKSAPGNVIHLADLDLLGMTQAAFRTLWDNSLSHTAKLLGHAPDLRSAAKTTLSLPLSLVGTHFDSWSPISY